MSERGRRIHILKTWPDFYAALINGDPGCRKTFEIRKDDRGFAVGDVLILQEYDHETDSYSGRFCLRLITTVLREQPFVPDGYVAMSICPCDLLASYTDDSLGSAGEQVRGYVVNTEEADHE